MSQSTASSTASLVEVLRRPRYEVLPAAGIEGEIAGAVPRDIPVTVTASPRQGMDVTIALTERICRAGYVAVPHLAARQVVDASHLAEILARLDQAGVREAFVVAGDCPEPRGRFTDSVDLLTAMEQVGHGLERIGIAGYPDGHPFIRDSELTRALAAKARFASYVVTQLCFDPAAVSAWVGRLRAEGLVIPVYLGVAGVVDRRRLLRTAARIGVGASARFLRKHRRPVLRLMLPRGYRPDGLIRELTLELTSPHRADGLHVYTFNNLRATEAWRQRLLAELTA